MGGWQGDKRIAVDGIEIEDAKSSWCPLLQHFLMKYKDPYVQMFKCSNPSFADMGPIA